MIPFQVSFNVTSTENRREERLPEHRGSKSEWSRASLAGNAGGAIVSTVLLEWNVLKSRAS